MLQEALKTTYQNKDGSRQAIVMPREYHWDPERLNRRQVPEIKRTFQIAELQERHHEVARRLVLGEKPKDIAKALNLCYQTIVSVKNSPVVQEQINLLSGARDAEVVDVAKQIRDLAPKCVKVLSDAIEDDETPQALKIKTSFAILDRAGHSVPKNVNLTASHRLISPQDLEMIKARALRIGLDSDIVEGEIVDTSDD